LLRSSGVQQILRQLLGIVPQMEAAWPLSPRHLTMALSAQITFTRVREGVRFRLQWLNDYMDRRTVKAA